MCHTLFIEYLTVMFFGYIFFFAQIRLRLGRGASSTLISLFSFPRLQLPLTGFKATDPCTLREAVFFKKAATVGLSLDPPCILCFPKKLIPQIGREIEEQ